MELAYVAPYMVVEVADLAKLCHPNRQPQHSPLFFYVYPTISLLDKDGMVAYASFTLTPGPTGTTMYGKDMGVHPDYRGKGYGLKVAKERLKLANAIGAVGFIGMTRPDNTPMRVIFEHLHLHACQTMPGYYTDEGEPADAIAYVGGHDVIRKVGGI